MLRTFHWDQAKFDEALLDGDIYHDLDDEGRPMYFERTYTKDRVKI
jgi:hypothetical protein